MVLGRSQIVGKPMALLLLQKGQGGDATVTDLPHARRATPPAIARQADILVAAMGRPEQVRADWIKPGAIVIDVGIHKRADGSPLRRRPFPERCRGGLAHHAGARRRRSADGRHAPAQHAASRIARLSTSGRRAPSPRRNPAMIRLGICNELFEGWEFGQVCRTVKALGL